MPAKPQATAAPAMTQRLQGLPDKLLQGLILLLDLPPVSADHFRAPDLHGLGQHPVLEVFDASSHIQKAVRIEFFGGTANAKHLLLTGIEADKNETLHTLTPESSPRIFNITLIGTKGSSEGVLLRRGTAGTIANAIVTGFGKAGVCIEDEATLSNLAAGTLSLKGILLFGNRPNTIALSAPKDQQANFLRADPLLIDPLNPSRPDFRPGPDSPALERSHIIAPPTDGFFKHADYLGGMGPDED